MQARVVLIVALCGATLIASGCRQDAGPQETPSPGSSASRPTMSNGASGSVSTGVSGGRTSASPTSTRTILDPESVRTSVLELLENTYGIDDVHEVSCPSGEEVVDGNSFRCTVVIQRQRKHVTITVRGTDGEYSVSRPE